MRAVERIEKAMYEHGGALVSGTFVAATGYSLADRNLVGVAVFGAAGSYAAYRDYRDRRKLAEAEVNEARGKGYSDGISTAVSSLLELTERQLDPTQEPFYTSRDGFVQIQTPLEMIQSLGGSIQSIATRAGIIVRHYDKRDLTVSEYETLRKIRLLIDYSNIDRQDLPAEQEELIHEVNGAIFDWEMADIRRRQEERISELKRQISAF